MPRAMVSIAVAQIASGTIRHGVRLLEDCVPQSGHPRPSRDFRLSHIDVSQRPKPAEARNSTSVPAHHRTEISCAQEPQCWKPSPQRAGKMTSM